MKSSQIEAEQKKVLDLSNNASVHPNLQASMAQTAAILEVALQLALVRENKQDGGTIAVEYGNRYHCHCCGTLVYVHTDDLVHNARTDKTHTCPGISR